MMYTVFNVRFSLIRQVVLVATFTLVACTQLPFDQTMKLNKLEITQQFHLQNLDQSWAIPQGAMINITRSLGTEAEQKIGLVNETTINGDNFLWLRARVPDGSDPGQFVLKNFVSRIGGAPLPFSNISDSNLKQGNDNLGPYFYLEWRSGSNINCVLAFRRISGGARILPAGTNTLEVALRNCVQGSITDALVPIQGRNIGFSAISGTQIKANGNQMLSPLAAPPLK